MLRLFRLLVWWYFYHYLSALVGGVLGMFLFLSGWSYLIISGRIRYDKPPGIFDCCAGLEQVSPPTPQQIASGLSGSEEEEIEDGFGT